MRMISSWLVVLGTCAAVSGLRAQERPYFVAYDQHMEEPGSFELALNPVFGHPDGGEAFAAMAFEVEYGAAGWWTTELYLTSQSTRDQGTTLTGWRLENRFRPLMRDYPVNPVLYVEYEDGNGADKTLLEVVGFDGQADQAVPVDEARQESEREAELKLILGSDIGGWNISENFVAAKNLSGEPWEFGYAVGANRPLALAASPGGCRFCRENFRVGVEFYGGLGEEGSFTARGTSQYVAPVVSWEVGNEITLRISPAFGLTDASNPFLLRLGFSYEFTGAGPWLGERRR
jgi:hypothetical protein